MIQTIKTNNQTLFPQSRRRLADPAPALRSRGLGLRVGSVLGAFRLSLSVRRHGCVCVCIESSVAFCSPAKSLTFSGSMDNPLNWQKVKVLTALGKMHQRGCRQTSGENELLKENQLLKENRKGQQPTGGVLSCGPCTHTFNNYMRM